MPRPPQGRESAEGVEPDNAALTDSALVPLGVFDGHAPIRQVVARYLWAVSSRSLDSLRPLLMRQAILSRSLEEPGQLALSVLEDQFRRQGKPVGPRPKKGQLMLVGVFSPEEVHALRGIRPLHLTPGPGQVLVTARPRGSISSSSIASIQLLMQRQVEGWRIAHILDQGEVAD